MSFQIIRDDITKVSADAIVNTANPKPEYAGGTDYAVYMAAGSDELLKERQKIGDIETGQAAATPSFALDAKYIIHTVGPAWVDGGHGEREAVRSCYENSLRLAKELGCESIAFPLIATGVYGFPKADALQIAVSVFSEFLADTDMEIILVVFDEASFVLSGQLFSGVDAFIDENYVSERLDSEYGLGASAPVAHGNALPDGRRKGGRLFADSLFHPRRKEAARAETGTADFADEEVFDDEACTGAPLMAVSMAMAGAEKAGRSLDDLMAHVSETWQQSLFRLIDEKGYTDTEVYKRANIDRKLFSKIRSNAEYQPKKITAVAFALALKLNLDETRDLLGRAGYALSPSSRFDLIIEYFIEQEVYDTYTINLALFEHKQPLLGV
ncbi:MAG: macro domain-containing protein [Lachnospiraceae bacterium]|nr:macro domain-containing protein [Lachnospiraceae bacterium]